MSLIPIPEDLLSHPSNAAHPKIHGLAAAGGVSLDDTDGVAQVLAFTHEVAAHNVQPDNMRRSDPSPRRSARVLRGELLGHRSPSASRSRSRDSRGSETASQGRYRSRSRPPVSSTIPEERVGRRGRPGGEEESDDDLRARIAVLEARHVNGVNALLGNKLVPVLKGPPPALPPLDSVTAVQQLPEDDVTAWLKHYGYEGGQDNEANVNALLACIGVYQ